MRRILVFLFALTLVLTYDLHGQISDYPFFELTDEDLGRIDLHDGSIDDWLDVLGDPFLTGLDFTDATEFGYDPYDPSDLDFRVWLAWHDATDRIYVAVERADDVYVNGFVRDRDIMVQHDSGMNFSIDGDNGRDPYPSSGNLDVEFGTRAYYLRYARDSQWYMMISQVFDEGLVLDLVNYWPAPKGNNREDWYLRPPYAEGGGGHFGERPTVSVNEFYLTPFDQLVWDDPAQSQVSDLTPGKRINFRMSLVDVEGELTRFDTYTQEAFFSIPEGTEWADGFLVGTDGTLLEEDTAVEGLSWGRIKATFRANNR
ncbi:MAG: hypothetical protein GKR89_11105 [Candidatus Latescibacteria bacterium]|nr:hypothetical protein [Candidatus Latescibacterota bacterium]